MAITPARFAEIRDLMSSEDRTHDQVDAVVDELLAAAEWAPSDPTADHLAEIADLRSIATTAQSILTSTANQVRDGWDVDEDLLRAVSRDIAEILARHQR